MTRGIPHDTGADERAVTLVALLNQELLGLHEAAADNVLALDTSPELQQSARRLGMIIIATVASLFEDRAPRPPLLEEAMARIPAALTQELAERSPEMLRQLVAAGDELTTAETVSPTTLETLDDFARLLSSVAHPRPAPSATR